MKQLNYIISRFKKIKRMLNDFIEQKLNIFQKVLIIIDMSLSIIIYGSGINDYFQYQFYKRKHIDRKNFIVYRKRMKIIRSLNDKEDRKMFDSKPLFNKVYSKYIGRGWLDIENSTYDDFVSFVKKHNSFIVKPSNGSHGKGIRKETITSEIDIRKMYGEIKSEMAILEEIIVQCEDIARFNPSSVNTLRVVTVLMDNGDARVMTANFRVGNGEKYADNFHHNGIAALLDTDSGIVVTSGIDMNFKRYLKHPITGTQIIGYKIPHWDKVVKTVKEAAKVTPTVRYVGWDVAVGDEGRVIIIEGNAAADPDISQMPDQIGKWPLYKDVIR